MAIQTTTDRYPPPNPPPTRQEAAQDLRRILDRFGPAMTEEEKNIVSQVIASLDGKEGEGKG